MKTDAAEVLAPTERDGGSDPEKRRRLRHMQWLANGLLLLAALVFAVATWFKAAHPALPYVAAFAEAAMVGALADWFAVVALFRHPLGLRWLPHTAIIPVNKDRIANNLGQFVQTEFFATERVLNVIQSFDPAARIAAWFAETRHAERSSGLLVRAALMLLDAFDDRAVREYLQRAVASQFEKIDLARLAGDLLDMLTMDGRHQALLDQFLTGVEEALAKPEVRERIQILLAQEMPLYFERLKQVGGRVATDKIVAGVLELLREVNADPQHPLRNDFDRMVARLIVRLKSDPEYRYRIAQFQQQLAADPRLSEYVQSLWQDLQHWLRRDLLSTDSSLRANILQITQRLARTLRDDAAMQQWINAQILKATPALVEEYRPKIGDFIAAKMREWKDDEIVNKLELNIGRDLQFIRLNGTLVGGMVGLLIYLASGWLGR